MSKQKKHTRRNTRKNTRKNTRRKGMRKYKGGGLCKTLKTWLKKGRNEINENKETAKNINKEVANNINHLDQYIDDVIRI